MTALNIRNYLHKHGQALRVWAWALFFLLPMQELLAQSNVTFEASVSVKEMVVGMPFELTFSLKNAEGARFTPPDFSGFKKGAISEMRGMSFVNGRSSSSQTWSLELIPVKPGTFTIGPATVVSGGKTISTKPLTLKVLSLAASNKGKVTAPPGSDDKVFVAAEFDTKEAYVGQQLTWRIRLYTQLSVEGYDIIALPDFSGFFSLEKIRYDKRVEYLTLRGGKKYAVRTLHEEAVFPQESGELTVGAARVSVGIEQPGSQGFLFGPKPVSLQTQPVSIRVKPLPRPAPNEFTGGVGRYEWTVKADTNQLSTDDALTIVVELKGNGDTRRFAPPKIAVPPNCEIFEPRVLEEEEYESEIEFLHRKRYEYIVLPKDTGLQVIHPVLTYFDVDSNRYCQLQSMPIRFAVTPGKNYQSPGSAADPGVQEPLVPQQPGFMEQIISWLSSPVFWSLLVLPFLALGIIMLLKKRKPLQTPQTPQTLQTPHPPHPLQTARQRFSKVRDLLNEDNPAHFYDELFKSLQAWLSARLELRPAQLNDADISKILLSRGATPLQVQSLLSVWYSCEQALYGAQTQADQMEPTWLLAEQAVEALERALK